MRQEPFADERVSGLRPPQPAFDPRRFGRIDVERAMRMADQIGRRAAGHGTETVIGENDDQAGAAPFAGRDAHAGTLGSQGGGEQRG
jgi:hypothetical protein